MPSKKRNKVDDVRTVDLKASQTTLRKRAWFVNKSELSSRLKKGPMLKLIVLFVTPVVILFSVISVGIHDHAHKSKSIATDEDVLISSTHLYDVITYIEAERCSLVNSFIVNRTVSNSRVPPPYTCCNKSLAKFPWSSRSLIINNNTFESGEDVVRFYENTIITDYTGLFETVVKYQDDIAYLTTQILLAIQTIDEGDIWQNLMSYLMLIKTQENIEVERMVGQLYFFNFTFPTYEYFLMYCRAVSVGSMTINAAMAYSPDVKDTFTENVAVLSSDSQYSIETTRRNLRMDYLDGDNETTVGQWREYVDNLYTLSLAVTDSVHRIENLSIADLDSMSTSTKMNLFLDVLALLVSAIVAPVTLGIILNITKQLRESVEKIAGQTSMLNTEKRKADGLLTQMLPAKVAEDLKNNKHNKAETFEEVTVFFSDVVDFMKYVTMMNPVNVIRMLNSLYSCFDARIKLYDVYKVETIGEVYMCVSGLPNRNGNRHAGEVAMMALHMQRSMGEIKVPGYDNLKLELRCGLNSGKAFDVIQSSNKWNSVTGAYMSPNQPEM
uniref:Uncharacterized protein LOC102809919 n=1 Tax=Saccoglossus kowalevskii TaxID=10224 RepID=A0ABM0MIT3_SACKO|nr:PREDICTED: uncharacterized protein LOC102809919 [Saccoglossus kowalevskii]